MQRVCRRASHDDPRSLDMAFVTALFARGLCDLEHAYQIVRDLDTSRGSNHQRSLDYKAQSTRNNSGQSQYKVNHKSSTHTEDPKGKSPAKSVPRTNPHTRCFKCQGYGHVEKLCPSKSTTLFLDDQSDEV